MFSVAVGDSHFHEEYKSSSKFYDVKSTVKHRI